MKGTNTGTNVNRNGKETKVYKKEGELIPFFLFLFFCNPLTLNATYLSKTFKNNYMNLVSTFACLLLGVLFYCSIDSNVFSSNVIPFIMYPLCLLGAIFGFVEHISENK